MLKRLLGILICCVGFAASIQGQNILTDKIQWNATVLTDLNHNSSESNAPCQFSTTASQIDWIQGNGSYVNSFTVLNTSGMWPDLSKPGLIVFSVRADVLTGDITFSRADDGGLTITLVLSGGTNPINISYTISTIEKL